MWMVVLAALAIGVWGQVPPPSPCPEVFQYLFRDGQWSGYIIVPETDAPQSTLKVSLYIGHVTPPVPGGLHRVSKETHLSGYLAFNVIFPIQSPIPHVKNITFDNTIICVGNPVYVPYIVVNSCTVTKSVEHTDCVTRRIDWQTLKTPQDTNSASDEQNSDMPANITYTMMATMLSSHNPQVQISCPEFDEEAKRQNAGCGVPYNPIVRTVYNGLDTKRGDWPWLAALTVTTLKKFLCGGSLISSRHVITAAHCFVVPKENIAVLLGKFNLMEKESDVQCRSIQRFVPHPEYNSRKNSNDIAILFLDEKVVYSDFVLPVCLWRPNMIRPIPEFGTVVGWGHEEKLMMISPTPKMATVPFASQEMCKRSHSFYSQFVNDQTLCAGNMNGTGPCLGDSGSGLLVRVPSDTSKNFHWYLRGIVSFNVMGNNSICHLDRYSLYTDIEAFSDWIDATIFSD